MVSWNLESGTAQDSSSRLLFSLGFSIVAFEVRGSGRGLTPGARHGGDSLRGATGILAVMVP